MLMANRWSHHPGRRQSNATATSRSPASLTDAGPEFVIDAYHQLWRVEKSFRMSKHDLQARPIYHHKRESIEAHLTIVFAALAVSNWIEHQTGWSIKKFVRPPGPTAPCRSEPASNLSPPPTPTRRPPPSPRHDQPSHQTNHFGRSTDCLGPDIGMGESKKLAPNPLSSCCRR
jgi:hypothetical protein